MEVGRKKERRERERDKKERKERERSKDRKYKRESNKEMEMTNPWDLASFCLKFRPSTIARVD